MPADLLAPIWEHGVDLRELHRDLESKRQFGNWADDKLSQFVEGQDFVSFNNVVKRETGASTRKDYAVSIECAKHIAMMERTERGRQVRQYFIDFEKAARMAEEAGAQKKNVPRVIPFDPANVPEVWPPPADGEKTMSSLEIAELTGKRHDNVMRDIRVTLEQAKIDERKFALIYLDARNREKPCYHLPRFECDLVVSGYSVKYRAAIIRRWHELESPTDGPAREYAEKIR